MKIVRHRLPLAVLLFVAVLSLLSAEAQITPGGDAYIDTAKPTTNFGKAVTLGVVSSSQTTFIAFDLSSIPSGYSSSSIAKATLKLYVSSVTTAGSFNVDLVNGSWSESSLTANNAPALGATIAASVPLTKAQAHDYVLIDITPALQDWLNGTPNDGVALVANGPLSATFESKENIKESHNAELDVVFAGGNGDITEIDTNPGSGLQGGTKSGAANLSLITSCSSGQILAWSGSAWACQTVKGSGTVTSVGLTAPASDFTVSGSPITTSGTLNISWLVPPDTRNTANAIVKRDASGSFSANSITAAGQITVNNGSSLNPIISTASAAGAAAIVGFSTGTGLTNGVLAATTSSSAGTSAIVGIDQNTVDVRTTFGVIGTTSNPSGNGVYGVAGASQTGRASFPMGVWGDSSSGIGVYGSSDNGTAVKGVSNSTGVYGVSSSGTGVVGAAVNGNAFFGLNDASGTPSDSNATLGLLNFATTPQFVLYAENLDGSAYVRTDNYGNLLATGGLTGAVKNFKIDHPLDPANKYLVHTDVESSEMMNIYTGNVVTDAEGNAQIELPDWFEALNKDFRYQLTVIGQFAQAIVSKKISDHRFSIKTDKPNVEVSWQVTGVRHDAWANAHRSPVEIEKTASERGRYLHPEAFGAGPEQSISYNGGKRLREMPNLAKNKLKQSN